MLTKSKSKQILKLKYLVLAPVVMAMLVYSSCQDEGKTQIDNPGDTIIVGNVENMTPTEENEVFASLNARSESSGEWELKVTDKKATIRFTKSENGSYISGPNGARIKAKMYIDSNDFGKDFNPLEDEASRAYKFPLADGAVPFGQVEQPPIYPGCENAKDQRDCFNKMMVKHIMKNFNYPEEAQIKGIQGRVAISFTIDKEGDITNIQKRGPDKLLENEADRIISKLPKMTPGKENGKVVDVPFSIPISFRLQ